MKYLYDVPFSTGAATDKYRDGWDAIFAKSADKAPEHDPDYCEECAAFDAELAADEAPDTEPAPPAVCPGDDCPCESGKAFAQCHGKVDPADE